ncbi:hypothetical protein Csa_010329 [Cucumis sativus]|uniref:Uncharacterized protein n=1 Tax=Cucumis sativus TaxID=3659 RepID=A0A0A0L6E6_CUCSA|nr:hypothetical protein Csa_010329 [Cucumis sativus]
MKPLTTQQHTFVDGVPKFIFTDQIQDPHSQKETSHQLLLPVTLQNPTKLAVRRVQLQLTFCTDCLHYTKTRNPTKTKGKRETESKYRRGINPTKPNQHHNHKRIYTPKS